MPRLLDLFCGAGGAAMGYHRAGFEVVGVDIRAQPRYPFTFHQADAMTFPLDGFDAIHASPPCEGYSTLRALRPDSDYLDLIPPTREMLLGLGIPWVMENVATAPLAHQATLDGLHGMFLCGSMFDLANEDGQLRRHRRFESNVPLWQPACRHRGRAVTVATKRQAGQRFRSKNPSSIASARELMGMPWATRYEIGKAIPPAYTEFIGAQLIEHLERAA